VTFDSNWRPPTDDDQRSAGIQAIVGLLMLAIVLLLAWAYESWSCGRQWKRSGMKTSWGPVQGCLVETSAGRWIPEDRVRALP
jgi:hypothetical protein